MYFQIENKSVLSIRKWKIGMDVINRKLKFRGGCFERRTEKLIT